MWSMCVVHSADLWMRSLAEGSKQGELLSGGVEDVNQASSLHASAKLDVQS